MFDARTSDIAHRNVAIANPISSQTLDAVIERARLPAGSAALDVGCGKGELLLRVAARYDVSAEGVDLSQSRVEAAQAEARRRTLRGKALFRCQDATKLARSAQAYSFCACVGSTHALGGLEATLRAFRGWMRPAGWIVIGEGFWMREPDPEYLAFLGADRDELGTLGWVEAAAANFGLEAVERWVSTTEDWDNYEGALLRGIESYVSATPADREGPQMLSRQRAFHAGQLRWGRSTMGFAVHLFGVPAQAPSAGAPR